MKNLINKSLVLAAAAFIAVGCETSEIPTFGEGNIEDLGVSVENLNAVRFPGIGGTGENGELVDTQYAGYSSADRIWYGSYSFIQNPLDASTEFDIPVSIIGMLSDVDRKVGVAVVAEETTAPAGSYEILDAVIPAGKREGYIRVKIANTAELASVSYELTVKLEKSADFNVGPEQYLTAKLIWNNILPAPTNNNLKRSYNMLIKGETNFISTSLNSYSTSAHLAIVDALGWDDWGSVEAHGSQANGANLDNCYNYLPRYTWIYNGDLYKAYAKILEDYLADYAEKNGSPLLHDGGKLIGQPVEARKY